MQSIFAMTNMVYTPQLNFVLMIGAVYIPSMAVPAETQSWDNCDTVTDTLEELKVWTQPSRQGLWHFFNDCISPGASAGVSVGIAITGAVSPGIPLACARWTRWPEYTPTSV
jgi:hypothetical protein